MASEGASPVLGTDVTMNPGASLSTFTAVPFPPPIPGAQHRPPWQQHLPRPITPAFPPGSSLLLPAFPRMPLVANGGRGPSAPGACNLTVQVRSQGRTVEAPQTQTFVVTQAPLNGSAPGALSRSAACPAPVFLATPVMGTVVTAPAVGISQAGKGGWTPGFPPQAPPPAAQLAPIIRPVNSGPWPHGTSTEGRLATNQSNASQDGSSNPQREYSNFRRWQRFKPLARRHFRPSPDAEDFSCFLIPVLRSVACLNPTMPLEEGLWRAVQEWRRLSNLDRMIYYEMAEKFMEFAAEEEMHIQNLQWMQCAQDLPPPAPPKLDPRGPPAPKVRLQPGTQVPTGAEGTACAPRMSGPRAQPSHPKPHRSQRTPEPMAPEEIPPETVREYVDRMEALVGPVHSARGKSHAECGKDGNELKQEEDDTYLDPCLLSYTDELRSREDSVTKVEAVIHPRFLAELFSPDPQLDLLALAEELKQEEGLTPEELVQKRLLALKEDEGGPAAPSHSAHGMGSSPSESHAGQGAQRHDQDRHLGVSDEACPPEIDFEALHRPIRTDTGPFVLRVFVPSRGRQAGKGGWTPGFPPQAPPPAAQLAPIIRPVNSGPWPHGTSTEGRLATNQSNASQDGSSNPQREYSNFRRWQRFKPLARRHFRPSPDAEAFSCFLIPVLRSVACLNPTMPLEEGLWRAVQEWRRLSNLDRMIYYEMAEKFMEFAAEEEMHIQNLQWMQCAQDLPPPAPPKLDPRGPPAPKVRLQPGTQVPTGAEGTACAPRMSGPRAQPSHPKPHRSQRTPEPMAPEDIPPETVREYVDRMEALVGPVHSARGKSHAECGKDGNELKQEEDDTYLDPCLLSYTDELRSREDSVTKVEAVIHPRFLAELFSPDPQLDLLALAEELKQEEGLTPEELVQKRLLDLKEDEGGPAAPSHSAPGMGSSPSESHAGQDAQRHDQDRHRGVSDEVCPPEIDVEALHRPIRTDTGPFRPKVFVPSRGRQEVSPFRAGRPSPPQGQRHTSPLLGPRDASVLREVSPVREARGPRDASSEDEEALHSLASVLASLQSLPPCRLSQSPAPASGLASPGGWGAQSAPQAPSPQRRGPSPAPPAAPKSRKRALCGRPAAAEKLPIPGAGHGVSARPALALGLARPSQPRKRKGDPFVTGKRRKKKRKHCSQ
ncbi:NUT family member 2G-like [Eschrichtius robustus]|uniref:NUT family member 2G-like n=1 Tax=Eschrichtius robustus TaxID=9764 RepID=UPI0035C0C442